MLSFVPVVFHGTYRCIVFFFVFYKLVILTIILFFETWLRCSLCVYLQKACFSRLVSVAGSV